MFYCDQNVTGQYNKRILSISVLETFGIAVLFCDLRLRFILLLIYLSVPVCTFIVVLGVAFARHLCRLVSIHYNYSVNSILLVCIKVFDIESLSYAEITI